MTPYAVCPPLRLHHASGTIDCSFRVDNLLRGLPIGAGNAIMPSGVFLDLAHSFWTYWTDMSMVLAMTAFLVPFLFPVKMHSTFDRSSFFTTRTRQSPICCHRGERPGRRYCAFLASRLDHPRKILTVCLTCNFPLAESSHLWANNFSDYTLPDTSGRWAGREVSGCRPKCHEYVGIRSV